MKPKNIRVRMDRTNGNLWLVEEKPNHPIRRIKDITSDVILALSAEIVGVDGTKKVERGVRFSDGASIRLTVEDITDESGSEEHRAVDDGTSSGSPILE